MPHFNPLFPTYATLQHNSAALFLEYPVQIPFFLVARRPAPITDHQTQSSQKPNLLSNNPTQRPPVRARSPWITPINQIDRRMWEKVGHLSGAQWSTRKSPHLTVRGLLGIPRRSAGKRSQGALLLPFEPAAKVFLHTRAHAIALELRADLRCGAGNSFLRRST